MTSKLDPQELERLSKAATQGVCPCCRAPCDVTIKPAYDFAWKDEFGNYQTTRHPAKRQYTYRTGQLVPAQPSGDVVEAVAGLKEPVRPYRNLVAETLVSEADAARGKQ